MGVKVKITPIHLSKQKKMKTVILSVYFVSTILLLVGIMVKNITLFGISEMVSLTTLIMLVFLSKKRMYI